MTTKPKRVRNGEKREFLESLIGSKETDCITWPYRLDRFGYGYVNFLGSSRMSANRALLILMDGEARDGLVAAHKCGNRSCVNPNHLYWATYKQNSRDRRKHGTHFEGADTPIARLTDLQAATIRHDRSLTVQEAADKFGVSTSSIQKIRAGISYKAAEERAELSPEALARIKKPPRRWCRRGPVLRDAEIARRLKILKRSSSKKAAAEKIGITQSSLWHFIRTYAPDLVRPYKKVRLSDKGGQGE